MSIKETTQSAFEPNKDDVAVENVVGPPLPTYSVGFLGLARWSEDKVWYGAKVDIWYMS